VSEFTSIRAVSLTLRTLLEQFITNLTDPQLAGVTIDLRSPREMREDQDTGISLWLYRVTRNPDTLNHRPPRRTPEEQLAYPLPVDLYYLVTPIVATPEDEQALLGKVLQVFNDHAIIRGSDLRDTLEGGTEELRVNLEMLTLEEISRIWDALKEPYALSVCYLVQLVSIDSDLEPIRSRPVIRQEKVHYQIVSG
jgi:hypothetical protein